MPPLFSRNTRWRAAAIHVAIGAALAALCFAVVRFAWYPDALFEAASAAKLMGLVAAVLLVAGPLATLVVYVPGKWGLKFDLVAIALLQATAVGYAMWTFFESRPVYVVFVKDRFELVRADDFPESEVARAGSSPFLRMPLLRPALAGARMPRDRAEAERIMFLAPSGLDLHHMPQHYVVYDAVRTEALARAQPLSALRKLNPAAGAEIDALVRAAGGVEEALVFLPMRAGTRDLTVVLDRRNGDVVRLAALRPWEY